MVNLMDQDTIIKADAAEKESEIIIRDLAASFCDEYMCMESEFELGFPGMRESTSIRLRF